MNGDLDEILDALMTQDQADRLQRSEGGERTEHLMKTQLLPASAPDTAAIAAKLLRDGELVALPTETVYGLGANGLDSDAVARIFKAKGRPQDNPLILHISDPVKTWHHCCHHIPDSAWYLARLFWPGPLTMILPGARSSPPRRRPVCRLSPSAARPPPLPGKLSAKQASPLLPPRPTSPASPQRRRPSTSSTITATDGPLAAIVDGGPCQVGLESTIVDLTGPVPCLLRPGGITPEQLRQALGQLEIDPAVAGQCSADVRPKAPGMKYRHYAPEAQVIIITGPRQAAADYIHAHFAQGDAVLCFAEEAPLYAGLQPVAYGQEADPATLCQGLFAALRQLDSTCRGTIYARCPEGGGMAYAVQNRLKKAAGFHIVNAVEGGSV